MVLHGVEGVGKTSFAAMAPHPIFGMAKGETGLETLADAGRLPQVPRFPEFQTWADVMAASEYLAAEEHKFKTYVLDAISGVDRLCAEEVCQRDFNGDWGKHGFTSYQQGWEVMLSDWRLFLNSLDRLRNEKHMAIICLCHTRVTSFKNPTGADYDRFTPALVHQKVWELTSRWSDMVLFANFFTTTTEESGRTKGVGGHQRVIYCERDAAWDAKNRHGLPDEIDMGGSGDVAWGNFLKALKGGGK